MLIEKDSKDRFQCTVTSTTQQTKTKTGVYENKGRYFLAHNSLTDVKQKFIFLFHIISFGL